MDAAIEHIVLRPGTMVREGTAQRAGDLLAGQILEVEPAALDMEARRLDRIVKAEAALQPGDDRLQPRRADGVGAARAEGEETAVAADDHRRGHHRGKADARYPAMEALRIEIFLAEHVVEHVAGAGHQRAVALAIGDGDGGGVAVAVDDADVGRAARRPRAIGFERGGDAPGEALGVGAPEPVDAVDSAGDGERPVAAVAPSPSSASIAAMRPPPSAGGGLRKTRALPRARSSGLRISTR